MIEFFETWLTWENVKLLSNSAFSTALIGSLAGAFAGAIAAQRIAERSKLREELLKEIRNTNVGIMLALTIANSALSLKKQHIKKIKSDYDLERTKILDLLAHRNEPQSKTETIYSFTGDLRSLPELSTPIKTLEEIVFSRLSTIGRPLSLSAAIVNATQDLNTSILKRNELTKTFKENNFPIGASLLTMYFGLPYDSGHVNQEFGDTVEAISFYTDDVIFFSVLLCNDLREHGLSIAARYKKTLKTSPPPVNQATFDEPRQNGLIPSDESYPTWFTAFQKAPKKKRRWCKFNGSAAS